MKIVKWLAPLALALGISSANAQTWTKLNSGIARNVTPNKIGVDIGTSSPSFVAIGTIVSGAFSLNGPTATIRGGVYQSSAPATKFATGIDTSGSIVYTQPQFNDLSNVSTQLFGTANAWTAKQTYGAGTYVGTANYTGSIATSSIVGVVGSSGSPNLSQDAVAVWQKTTGVTATSGVNATTYSSIFKTTTGANTHATSGFDEAQDNVGGANSFIEGRRSHAVLTGGSNGSAYGAVLVAGTAGGIGYQYLIGAEAEAANQSGSDAPIWSSFNVNAFSAGFVATSKNGGTGNKTDIAFVTNPYSAAPFRTGYGCYGDDGGGRKGVDHTCYAVTGSVPYGLDLRLGTFSGAAIRLPNLGVVRSRNAANNADHNILYYDGSNQVVIGADATAIVNSQPVVNASYQRATSFIGNGSSPTITGSGSCTLSTQVGGSTVGKFTATAACAAGQTYTISGLPGSINGYACDATDHTTAGVVFQQTSDSTTSAVLTVRTTGVANGDVIQFKCMGY